MSVNAPEDLGQHQVGTSESALSVSEFGIWLVSRNMPESFNIHRVWHLSGALDETALRGALAEVSAAHRVFARRLRIDGDVPSWVSGPAEAEWLLDTEGYGSDVEEWTRRAGHHRFDLAQDCPLRAALLRRTDGGWLFSLLVHHIACDGAGLEIVLRDLGVAYAELITAETNTRPQRLSAMPASDFPMPSLRSDTGYWSTQLADARWPGAMPRTDGPRTAAATTLTLSVTAEDARLVRETARGMRTTAQVLGLTGLYAALAAHGNPSDVLVATPFAGRTPATADVVACFARLVPLRQRWPAGAAGTDLVERVRQSMADALRHWDEPIREVSPLFDPAAPGITICYQAHGRPPAFELAGVQIEGVEDDKNPLTRFDLEFDLYLRPDGGQVTLTRRAAGGVTEDAAAALLSTYRDLLLGISARPTVSLPQLQPSPAAELAAVVRCPAPSRSPRPLRERLRELVQTMPASPAVSCGDSTFAFAELDNAVARLCNTLRENGAAANTPVGILAPPGAAVVAAVLAVWELGAYVVPLDPLLPEARLEYVLADTGTALVLRAPELEHRLPAVARSVPLAGQLNTRPVAGRNRTAAVETVSAGLAYVIHTSGTTGRPKGVLVEHGGLASYAEAQSAGRAAVRVGLTGALSFDVFFLQLLHLYRGSCLVVAEESVYRDAQALVAWVERHEVDFLCITPSLFHAMCHFGFEDLLVRTGLELELGGEPVDEATWARLRQLRVRGANAYGPTETTIQTTGCRFLDEDHPAIGRPLQGTSAYVLGPDLRPVPFGVAGELYLAGPQVSRGYLGDPALTAERFLPDPFDSGGARMYRTGDRVRMEAGGCLRYLRRADDQLKVRGQRVDPYEVEAVLRSLPGVQTAYVSRRLSAEVDGLQGYLVARGTGLLPTGEALRLAAQLLPAAAVPARLTVLEKLPLTPSGKVDESALPRPQLPEPGERDAEDPVAELWRHHVGSPPATRDENFFSAGGSSLDAARLVAALNQRQGSAVDVASFFADPTPAGLRQQLRYAESRHQPIAPNQPTELSAAQRRLWLLHRAAPASTEFTVYWALRVHGDVDVAALQAAWTQVVTRYPELRLRVVDGPASPSRAQWPAERFGVTVRTIGDAELAPLLREAVQRCFDILDEPLIELTCLRTEDDNHVLLFVGHHLVLDRHSMNLINQCLLDALAGRASSSVVATPANPDPCPAEAQRLREFWVGELAGVSTAAPIDTDGAARADGVATVTTDLDTAAWQRLTRAARSHRTTPLALTMAAFALTADRYGAAGDVLVGTTMDVRPPGCEDAVGLFVNPVPVRLQCRPGLSDAAVIDVAHQSLVRAHAHRQAPFDTLVRDLGHRSELGAAPLFQVLIEYEPLATLQHGLAGGTVEPVPIPADVAKYDLEVVLAETQTGARLDVVHRGNRWNHALVQLLAGDLVAMLGQLAEAGKTTTRLSAAGHLEGGPAGWGRGAELTASPRPVHAQVIEVAERFPNRPAVTFRSTTLTYAELRQAAEQVASALVAGGIRRADRVAVLTDRSAAMVPAVLGVHLAGAAYVPLDPEHPDARLRQSLADSSATAVLVTAGSPDRARSFGIPVLTVGDTPNPASFPTTLGSGTAHDPAYAIFTSGSTGRPKAVVVEHGALAASTAARQQVYPANMVFLLLSPLAFDSAAAGIWGTLTTGGQLIVADTDEIRDPDLLISLIQLHSATHLLCVPSLYAVLLRRARNAGAATLATLKEVVVAGEPLPQSLLDEHFELLPGVAVTNEYGPTEAAIWCSFRRYRSAAPVTIGGPIPGARLYVLDHALRPTPVGISGELYVGGPGVARGYFGRPKDTAAAFLPDPFCDVAGARMYRTGDRVRWSEDGELVFLGRTDEQLKVRGHRLHPGEIEEALRAVTGVREAAVVLHKSSLVAFVTGSAQQQEVRRHALEALPAYMVPGMVHVVPELPKTSNGKVDRNALHTEAAALAGATTPSGRNGSSQHTDIAAAWREVLGVPDVPENVNFFDLGGHSLLIPALQDALHAHTGVRVPILDLFRYSTVADLAARLAERPGEGPPVAPTVTAGRSRRDVSRQLRNRRKPEASS